MNTVCHSKSKYNADGCVPLAMHKDYFALNDVLSLACNTTQAVKCPELLGVFSANKGWSGGECGVVLNSINCNGKGLVSGPGSDYSSGSKSAQYYGLCSVPRVPASSLL